MPDITLQHMDSELLSELRDIKPETQVGQPDAASFNYLADRAAATPLDNEVVCIYENLPSMIDIIQQARTEYQALEGLMALPDYQISDAARAQKLIYTKRDKFVKTDAKRNVCQKLFDKLTGVSFIGEYECSDYIRIPIAEIHCPHTSECSTTYIWSSETETSTNFTVEVVGASAGGGASINVVTTQSLTSVGACKYVSKLCWVKVECWRTKTGEIIQIPRIVSVTNGLCSVPLPRHVNNHFCTHELAKVQKVVKSFSVNPAYYAHCLPFSLSKSDSAKEKAIIREGLIVDVKNNLSFHALDLPISLDIRVKSTVTNEFGYELSLEGGHDYLGFYRGFDSSAYMWAWQQNGMS